MGDRPGRLPEQPIRGGGAEPSQEGPLHVQERPGHGGADEDERRQGGQEGDAMLACRQDGAFFSRPRLALTMPTASVINVTCSTPKKRSSRTFIDCSWTSEEGSSEGAQHQIEDQAEDELRVNGAHECCVRAAVRARPLAVRAPAPDGADEHGKPEEKHEPAHRRMQEKGQ